MIVDAFIFAWELDLLELRLNELSDTADLFVVCEATRTFTGIPKPLVYLEHQDDPRFAPFKNRIRHVIVDDMPSGPHPGSGRMYEVEAIQRNAVLSAMTDLPGDTHVLMSDADELPNPRLVKRLIAEGGGEYTLMMRAFYYYLNLECGWSPWAGTRLGPLSTMRRMTPMQFRIAPFPRVAPGGWHFGFAADAEGILRKLQSWSHVESLHPPHTNLDYIRGVMERGEDWDTARNAPMRWLDIDSTWPRYVTENMERWAPFIGKPQGVRA